MGVLMLGLASLSKLIVVLSRIASFTVLNGIVAQPTQFNIIKGITKQAENKKAYRVTNWSDYNQSLKNRGNLSFWIDPETEWYAKPNGKPGRNHKFTDAAIQTCLTIKVLLNLPLRQTQGFIESIIHLAKLDWEVPNYSTLSRRQKDLSVCIPYQSSPQGMCLLIDSTGIKITGEGEWHTKKHGKSKRRQWRKVHIGIDADTGQVRAVGVTTNDIGDPNMLPDLLKQIPDSQDIEQVIADGAYDTKDCHHKIADRHADPIIPPRSNAVIWEDAKHQGDRNRNEAVAYCAYLGRKLWKQTTGYHKRSLVETAMYRLKGLGERLMARDFARQVAEVHLRVAVLNRFTMLGMPVTVAI